MEPAYRCVPLVRAGQSAQVGQRRIDPARVQMGTVPRGTVSTCDRRVPADHSRPAVRPFEREGSPGPALGRRPVPRHCFQCRDRPSAIARARGHHGAVADRRQPRHLRQELQAYADLGTDRLMCLHQVGGIGCGAVPSGSGSTYRPRRRSVVLSGLSDVACAVGAAGFGGRGCRSIG